MQRCVGCLYLHSGAAVSGVCRTLSGIPSPSEAQYLASLSLWSWGRGVECGPDSDLQEHATPSAVLLHVREFIEAIHIYQLFFNGDVH